MSIFFFIKSSTVDISNYNIKDISGSSGRLDVISRCILAALLNGDNFCKDIQIWVFFDKYGTFIFDSNLLNYDIFPKNEILLSDHIVKLIKNKDPSVKLDNYPLNGVKISKMDIIEALKHFMNLNYEILVLNENGKDFSSQMNFSTKMNHIIFVVGSQSGDFVNSKELMGLNFTNISLGTQSYLASSVIRLIKLNLN